MPFGRCWQVKLGQLAGPFWGDDWCLNWSQSQIYTGSGSLPPASEAARPAANFTNVVRPCAVIPIFLHLATCILHLHFHQLHLTLLSYRTRPIYASGRLAVDNVPTLPRSIVCNRVKLCLLPRPTLSQFRNLPNNFERGTSARQDITPGCLNTATMSVEIDPFELGFRRMSSPCTCASLDTRID